MKTKIPGIQPYILGSGRAADAMRKGLALLALLEPGLGIRECRQLSRGAAFPTVGGVDELSLLVIAHPPGLHARAIVEGEAAGFGLIVTEKPACVNREEVACLKLVRVPVAVCHGYRMMWGPQTLKKMIAGGQLGRIFAIEGRYWQSSTAYRAITGGSSTWKNDPGLSGPHDAFLDVGTHWMDAVTYLFGELPSRGQAWLSHANAERPHRDSHVQLTLDYASGCRALGSISKTVHGAGNHFELRVLGAGASAHWQFLKPDEIILGRGREETVKVREDVELGSGQAAFHGLGWLEGYVEIFRQAIHETLRIKKGNYPRLDENLELLESMLGWELTCPSETSLSEGAV